MHEAALAQELLSLIEETASANGARVVTKARVEVGALSCVSADALELAFLALQKGKMLGTCRLQIERTPLRAACTACGKEHEVDPRAPSCPHCGDVPLDVLGGRELRLLSIDVEDD